jgi:hypothetical protein
LEALFKRTASNYYRGSFLQRSPTIQEYRSLEFVKQIQPLILSRRQTDIVDDPDHMWVLQESAPAYGQQMGHEKCR